MELGESVAVVLRHSVYEGDVLAGWSEDEREKYHDADPEARERFARQAVALAREKSAPDIEVYVDGNTVWKDY